MKSRSAPSVPEFSRRVELAKIGVRESIYSISAKSAEREALAGRFGLVALDRLEAELRLSRLSRGMIRLIGLMRAELVQACVITLTPLPASVSEEFTLLYGPGDPEATVVIDLETDVVEPLQGNTIDIGEAVAQQLALALDPYPRAPGASLGGSGDDPDKGKTGR